MPDVLKPSDEGAAGTDSLTLPDLDRDRTELILGLVAPVGTDLELVETFFRDELQRFGYSARTIRLSDITRHVQNLGFRETFSSEYERIEARIGACNKLRELSGTNYLLALYAAHTLRDARARDAAELTEPLPTSATILHSLKHPEEVRTLRRIYGPGFYLVGVYTPESQRLRNLTDRKLMTRSEATALLLRDEDEPLPHGQHTRDTYELSDVFIPLLGNEDETRLHVRRFLSLVFGNSRVTPTADEHCMFVAFSAALRSGSLARQVGAAIATRDGDVLAIGANDAPKFRGGQYWPGANDQRDCARGVDENDQEKRRIVIDIMKALRPRLKRDDPFVEYSDEELFYQGRLLLANTGVLDITEYSRDAHAEMAALLQCARLGIATREAVLYCTTFPCHNCAKHVVTAGIEKVVFVEPYPKSRALRLHGDALSVWDGAVGRDRLMFHPFLGIGPRRFFDLFSLKLGSGLSAKRKDDLGRALLWDPKLNPPRVQLMAQSYLQREIIASTQLASALEAIDNKVSINVNQENRNH